MLARFQYAVALAVFVLLRGLSVPRPGETNSADSWQNQYDSGRFQEAIATLNKVLELVPTNPVALYHLGCCQYQLGDFKHAAVSFQQLLAANTTNAEGHYWFSISL